MKDLMLCYSIGALLYCPANNETIVDSLVNEKFGKQYSLALCLEDTIRDDRVQEAEQALAHSLHQLSDKSKESQFYLPKIFVRVREPEQILRFARFAGKAISLVTGFILPKFCPDNADAYIDIMLKLNANPDKLFYMMPIMESPSIIDMQNRYSILYSLKEKLAPVRDFILNIRVGGNDLCHVFGFRRHSSESIYSILPIANILSDIVTVFGTDYVVSGPVWEYYSGEGWDTGLKNELNLDRLCGFTGKTVIHPKQIPLVNESLAVSKEDYRDALSILNWDSGADALVSGSPDGKRMNEYKTHYNWARKTAILSQIYGIKKQ